MPYRAVLAGAFCLALAAYFLLSPSPCSPAPLQEPERGSHGFRIWPGDPLHSFDHKGQKICVPKGFETLGASHTGRGWATFPEGVTGVLIRSDAFASETLTFKQSSYTVTLRYPKETSAEELIAFRDIVSRAFEQAGALYDDKRKLQHTVLVAAGLGTSEAETESLYPDPGSNVSYLILSPKHPRSAELFTHAVMHLYNRHRTDLGKYQDYQQPFSPGDFQEFEASWSETAFIASDEERAARLAYLYNVHAAVMTHNSSLIKDPPFNVPEFAKLKPGATAQSSWTYLDDQYGYYILAPLIAVAIEGLLAEHRSESSIASLLAEVHANNKNFLATLSKQLSPIEISQINAWITGKDQIPEDLILLGATRYQNR